MLNVDEINNTIKELENGSTTFESCNKLASLYIVRDNIKSKDIVESELQDILPQYRTYCNVKRKYQLHEVTEQAVYTALTLLGKEVKEFYQSLISSADTPKEKEILQEIFQFRY